MEDDMPHGSFPGKAKKKGSSDHRHKLLRGQIAPWTSKLFRDQHLVFPDDPQQSLQQGGIGSRDVPVSTAIVADRSSVNKLIRLAKFWNNAPATKPTTGKVETTSTTFPIIEWRDGKKSQKEAYVCYSMVQDDKSSRWIIHHLDSTVEHSSKGGKGEWLLEDSASSDDEGGDSGDDE
jgi:hypothetical protein